MKPVFKIEVKLPIKIFKGESAFVAHCASIDIASQGDTPEEARKNIIEAITLFLATCFEQGTLSSVLAECGFLSVDKVPENIAHPDGDFVDIPIPFMIPDLQDAECHA